MRRQSIVASIFSTTVAASIAGCGVDNEQAQLEILQLLSSGTDNERLEELAEAQKQRELTESELLEATEIEKRISRKLDLKSAIELGRD